jgi:LAS superfamily LD-carboxypeptidase LdcB
VYTKFINLQKELSITSQTSQESTTILQNQINELTQKNEELMSVLTEEQKKNLDLEKLKRKNERKIDTLEKLTTLDPELLKKYSKVFFLSENYSPSKLTEIPEEFRIKEDKDLQILEEVEPFLTKLLEDAQNDGVHLRVISAYRSFDEQKSLKSNYTTTYGVGANKFSADQGYSEHQLGTTVDFGTPEVTGAYMSFEKTEAFIWLKDNAYKYGFIMSYPHDNTYYQYEPWHWRFVGEDLAEDLHDDNKNFYELDQREIDEYLLEIFD